MPPRPGRFAPRLWRASCLALALAACAGSAAPPETDPGRDAAPAITAAPTTSTTVATPSSGPATAAASTTTATAAAPTQTDTATTTAVPTATTTTTTATTTTTTAIPPTTSTTDPPAKPATAAAAPTTDTASTPDPTQTDAATTPAPAASTVPTATTTAPTAIPPTTSATDPPAKPTTAAAPTADADPVADPAKTDAAAEPAPPAPSATTTAPTATVAGPTQTDAAVNPEPTATTAAAPAAIATTTTVPAAIPPTTPATDPPTNPATTTTVPSETGAPRRYRPQPVEILPHDRTSFTQGLAWRQGVFYESAGLYGKSSVRIVDPATGEVIKEQPLPDRYFGEGLEVVGDRVVQLTWREETAFIWETETLAPLGTFSYQGEGWGLCAQADRFVMSDGSDVLTFRHLETFAPLGSVRVARNGEPVARLNELECAGGLVYANIWLTDSIAVIDPDTGAVTALVDCSGLAGLLDDREGIDVLNGIAYRPDQDRFYLTGKLWPNLFLAEMVPDP